MPDIIPRLRSHGISRTPTPSDSSDSQSSLASSSTDSCDITEDLTVSDVTKHTSVRNFDFTNSNLRFDHNMDVKPGVLDSKEMCFSKSERICNEAKIAMQERLVNAKINEMYGTCSYMPCGNLINKSVGLNGLVSKGHMKLDGTIEQQPQVQYDPLRGGPFDPGPVSHEEKLRYLQTLQSQLEELKMKQKILKEQEQQHIKKQRHPQQRQDCIKPVSQGVKQLNSKQVVQGGKQENVNFKQVCTDVKPENIQNLKVKQETNKHKTVKLDSDKTSSVNMKDGANDKIKASDVLTFHQYCTELNVRGLQSESLLPNDIKSFEPPFSDKSISQNPQIIALEKKLQQNVTEQKQLKNTLTTMLAEQHKLEEQIGLQHQNEQLRLHQHFIIQEQLRQLAQESKNKKEEVLNMFLFQQQSLLAQQNLKLQCVRQNYVMEVQKVQGVLEKLETFYAETMKKSEALKTELRNKQITSVMKNSIATPTAVNTPFHERDTLKVEVKQENLVLSPKSKSPRKDHSIASILQVDDHCLSPKKISVTQESPKNISVTHDTAEFEKSMVCDSCKFLNDYGMHKKWCSKCDELKRDQGSSQQLLARPKSRVESTFLQKTVVPSISNIPRQDFETLENPVEQGFSDYNYVLDLEIHNVHEPGTENMTLASGKMKHVDHNYLSSNNDLEHNVKNNSKLTVNVDIEKHNSVDHLVQTVSSSITTSTATISPCNPNLMSPIIPYASVDVSENVSDVCKTINKAEAELPSDNTDTKSKTGCNSSNKTSERVTFNLNEVGEGEIDKDMTEETEKDEGNYLKPGSAVKHIRSHSQSEIYDQRPAADNPEQWNARHVRCQSHSELNEGDTKSEHHEDDIETDAGEEAGAKDIKDVDDAAEKDEDSVKAGKKRKLARCYSVPGWFGKGLNIKKRRRY